MRRGLGFLVEQRASPDASLDKFAEQSAREDGPFGEHLRRILMILSRDAGLLDTVRDLLQEKPCSDFTSFHRLRSAGIVEGEFGSEARFRCELYARYLKKHLL
uniref:AAA-like domain-containing protein n=1 Tax=Candidatus Kentrum sp. MB TaxID=2138164 RepID=A0A450X0R6_9GAMM|nr:MAG: AAA-like domain-containing protein [Candidatus Kentron sp. MB]